MRKLEFTGPYFWFRYLWGFPNILLWTGFPLEMLTPWELLVWRRKLQTCLKASASDSHWAGHRALATTWWHPYLNAAWLFPTDAASQTLVRNYSLQSQKMSRLMLLCDNPTTCRPAVFTADGMRIRITRWTSPSCLSQWAERLRAGVPSLGCKLESLRKLFKG